MKKFIVETYYTCTFKTVHTLNDLNDQELSKIDNRTDGSVEVIDVKLNNRKTKKIGDNKKTESKNIKLESTLPQSISEKMQSNKESAVKNNESIKIKRKNSALTASSKSPLIKP